jgi:hypothetical protein
VVNTYRVWLRYELFRGRLSEPEFQGSEANLVEFVKARGATRNRIWPVSSRHLRFIRPLVMILKPLTGAAAHFCRS